RLRGPGGCPGSARTVRPFLGPGFVGSADFPQSAEGALPRGSLSRRAIFRLPAGLESRRFYLTGARLPPSRDRIRKMPKTELHQHVDGSIPPSTIWRMMRRHGLTPVRDPHALRKLLTIQPGEEGTLLAYLDKFHYPLWITQFYENIQEVTEAIARDAAKNGVKTLELRYSPVIHTYAGLTLRQAI